MTQHKRDIAHDEKEVSRVVPRSANVIEFCQRHAIESHLVNWSSLSLIPRLMVASLQLGC